MAQTNTDEYSLRVNEDLSRQIDNDILLQDIVEGKTDLPEYLDPEDILFIKCYLPMEKREILDRFIKRFLGSFPETREIKDFNGWFGFFYTVYSNAYKENLALVMMMSTGNSFTDWLALFHATEIFAVKRFAVLKMKEIAKTKKELKTWRRFVKQLGMPADIKKEG